MTPKEPTGITKVGAMDLTMVLTKGVINNMTEIKPCPFCASQSTYATVMNNYVYVACNGCGASGPAIEFNVLNLKVAKERAIQLWNRRFFVWE